MTAVQFIVGKIIGREAEPYWGSVFSCCISGALLLKAYFWTRKHFISVYITHALFEWHFIHLTGGKSTPGVRSTSLEHRLLIKDIDFFCEQTLGWIQGRNGGRLDNKSINYTVKCAEKSAMFAADLSFKTLGNLAGKLSIGSSLKLF